MEYKSKHTKRSRINEYTKLNQNKHVDSENRAGPQRGMAKMTKEDQLYGDRWKLNFWCWDCSEYKNRNIMLYTWNLHDVISVLPQCKINVEGFPGGSVVKNSPPNVEDTVSIPDLGRFYMPRSYWAHNFLACALEPGSHNYEACTPWSLCSATGEATTVRSLCTATRE